MVQPHEIVLRRAGRQARHTAGVGLRAWFSDLWLVWFTLVWLTVGFGVYVQPDTLPGWLSFAEGLAGVLSVWHSVGFWRRRRRFRMQRWDWRLENDTGEGGGPENLV